MAAFKDRFVQFTHSQETVRIGAEARVRVSVIDDGRAKTAGIPVQFSIEYLGAGEIELQNEEELTDEHGAAHAIIKGLTGGQVLLHASADGQSNPVPTCNIIVTA